jgi:mannose/fructose/N-acetylgalactosamine-specific phosphotransferase system component IIB
MKKSTLLFVAIFVMALGLFAQNQKLTVNNNGSTMNQTVLTLSNEQQTTIRFDVNELELMEVNTGYEQVRDSNCEVNNSL